MRLHEILTESLIDRAKHVAIAAHGHQMYGKYPYSYHLTDVVNRVKTITQDPEIIAAAWLHDTVEDTDITIENISSEFGENVANMVWAVTGTGSNRKEKMADAIAKIAQTPGSEMIKSADRLSNASASAVNNPTLLKMYKDEHKDLSPVLGNNALAMALLKLFSN